MDEATRAELEAFVVEAKAATYVGDGAPVPPCRPSSHDLSFVRDPYAYLDSYFGGADFLGEEIVWREGVPIWGMNYHGRILDDAAIEPAEAGRVIKASLTALYREGRFLGGFEHEVGDLRYFDESEGGLEAFHGIEWIERDGARVYELRYHGGSIRQ